MPRINLLPWREELRKRQQKEFGLTALAAVVLAVLAMVAVHFEMQARIDFQRERNAYLEQQSAALDRKIKEIQDLEAEKRRLLARMQIIEQLQSSRPEIVHLFDEFVETLPEGVFYTTLAQRGPNFSIVGVAQSNARVSSLMRNLDSSEFLGEPSLVEIKARNTREEASAAGMRLSDFAMNVAKKKKKPAAEG